MPVQSRSSRTTKLFPRTVLATALLGSVFTHVAPGFAQGTPPHVTPVSRSYDIPAGALQTALNRFGRESGILLAFTPEQTANLTTNGLRGQYTVQSGLDKLLEGTGLGATQDNGSYLLVRREPAGQASHESSSGPTLPQVTVSAAGPAETYRPQPSPSTLRSDLPLQDTPQVVNIVPAQVLQDQRPRNLDDALGNVSGITQGNTLAGTQDTIMKRGFGGNRDGSIMHNGMPLVQGRGFNAAAESVEVVKGPASLLYGIMDPGGVVNIVSKVPELKRHTELSLRGSTYGHGKNGAGGTLDTTGAIGDTPFAYRLVAATGFDSVAWFTMWAIGPVTRQTASRCRHTPSLTHLPLTKRASAARRFGSN